MQLLDETNAAEYLRRAGWIGAEENPTVRQLAGGVSNVVLLVERGQGGGDDFVIKQAREQLRVALPWFCSVERIWREVDVLRVCEKVLARTPARGRESFSPQPSLSLPNWFTAKKTPDPLLALRIGVAVPHVLFEDRENFVYAMTAAPAAHRTWKQDLLSERFDPRIAAACGELLGRLHAGTWLDADLAGRLADRTYFHDLRVDPYYRHVAKIHSELRVQIDNLIASLEAYPRCLVHGDFSPKNLLVWDADDETTHVMLVDCEVGHFGDPAFDLGFFLSHLLLKAVYHGPLEPAGRGANDPLALAQSFWSNYLRIAAPALSLLECDMLQQRTVKNLAGCLLARVDGKSPVEYLRSKEQQEKVRRMGRELLFAERAEWDAVWGKVQRMIES